MKSDFVKQRVDALTENQLFLFNKQLQSLNESNQIDVKEDSKAQLIAYIKGSVSREDIQSHIKNHLPDYMIPSKFIILDEFPRLPNGKIDYKSLEIKSEEISSKIVSDPSSNSAIEKKLIAIWEEILNFSPLSINDNFFEIGGDSILSILIITRARKEGILLEANQIFEHQTIAELALHAKSELPASRIIETPYTGDVELSPMQHRFFGHHSSLSQFWNLAYKLKLKENVSSEVIEKAVNVIIERHESLRLKFVKSQNTWKAKIIHPNEIKAYSHLDIDTNNTENYEKYLDSAEADFSLSDPVLFKVIYSATENSNDSSVLFFAHHLLLDHVAWKVIIDDFESILDQIQNERTICLSPVNTPYHKWIESVTKYANSDQLSQEIPYWLTQNSNTDSFSTELKTEHHKEGISKGVVTLILDTENSKKLLHEANSPYNTRIEDLLIFVLSKTLLDWTKLDALSIGLERTGREWKDSSIDPSGTVGWLTSYFPFKINLKDSNLSEDIKAVKEQLRKIPLDGTGYGLLRYCNQSEEVKRSLNFQPQVSFNYFGIQNESKENMKSLGLEIGNPTSLQNHHFEINSFVSENQLHIYLNYSEDSFTKKTVQEIVDSFEVNLKSVIQHCTTSEKIEYTPSDFPESGLNEDELNNLLDLFN